MRPMLLKMIHKYKCEISVSASQLTGNLELLWKIVLIKKKKKRKEKMPTGGLVVSPRAGAGEMGSPC